MNRITRAVYELDVDERFNITIDSEGGAYLAFGSVNNFDLPFTEAASESDVTPAVLAGPHSVNLIHLHLVYTDDEPAQSYVITVKDQDNANVDVISSTLDTSRERPYRVDVDLVARVR